MMSKRKKTGFLATAALFLALPAFAWAADKDIDPLGVKKSVMPDMSLESCTVKFDTKKSYALADLIHFGLCNNNTTRQSWAVFLGQQARLGSARGAYLPTINATGDLTRTETNVQNFAGGSNTMGSGAISLQYLLFDFGQRESRIEQVKQNLIGINYDNSLTIQNVLFQIVQSYYDFFASKSLLKASQESEEAARVSFEAASLREHVGRAPIVEKLQAETAYSQAKLRRVEAENVMKKNKGSLMRTLGIDPTDDINVIVPDLSEINEKQHVKSTKEIVEYAKKAHPDILSAQARVESQKAFLDLERRRRMPSISTTADVGTQQLLSGNGIERNTAVVGLRLSIPLFTGFSRTYDIQAARHDVEAAEAQLGQAKDRVALDIWNAYQDFNTADQNIETTASLYKSAGEAEKAALGRYKAGKGTLIELLEAQVQMASARQQRVQARYDWLVSKANLLRAAGNISPQDYNDQ